MQPQIYNIKHLVLITVIIVKVQCSSFITHLDTTFLGVLHGQVLAHGILQRMYRKLTIKSPFSMISLESVPL